MKTTQLGIELGSRHLRIAATKKKEFLKIKNMIAFDEDDKDKAIGDEAFSFAGNGNGSEGEYVTYLTDEEYEKNKAYVYQEDEKAGFVNVYLPSTLKRVGANVFYGAYVDGIYMEWCTSPDALPSFDPTFVEDKLAGIHQIYFTKETIDAYGDELDAYFMNTNAKDCCWYPNGQKAYWSSQALE